MANLGAVVDFLLMLSIGGLAGLVIALHLKLRQFSAEAGKVPALADDLTRAITASKSTMQALADTARTDGARLEDLVAQAESTRQEMLFVIDRAEKVLSWYDNQLAHHPVPRQENNDTQTAANGAHVPPGHDQKAQMPQSDATSQQTGPQQAESSAAPPEQKKETENKAAIMPGRYQARLGVDQNGRPRPYKPASFQSGAAAYGANATQPSPSTQSATQAESELRRALENAI